MSAEELVELVDKLKAKAAERKNDTNEERLKNIGYLDCIIDLLKLN